MDELQTFSGRCRACSSQSTELTGAGNRAFHSGESEALIRVTFGLRAPLERHVACLLDLNVAILRRACLRRAGKEALLRMTSANRGMKN